MGNNETSTFDKLNDKQKLFVLEYCRTMNASLAYSLSYPSKKRNDTIRACASRMLTFVNIKSAIQERLDLLWSDREKEVGRILAEIQSIAYCDISDYIEIENNSISIKDLNRIDTRAIQNIRYSNNSKGEINISITMHSKMQALQQLCKILKMYPDNGNDPMDDIIIKPAIRPSKQEEA